MPAAEILYYCQKSRSFETNLNGNEFETKNIENEIQDVTDFCPAHQTSMSTLNSICEKYAFLEGASANVERAISHFSNVLSDDRRSFGEKNLEPKWFLVGSS